MDIQITKANGTVFSFEEYGITVKDFIVSSISLRAKYNEIEGKHGTVNYGATYGTRTITVPFYFKSTDLVDYALIREELFSLAVDIEPFYIREMRRVDYQTGDNQLLNGKRYLVRLQNTFSIEQLFKIGQGELVFETTDLPFAESIATTQSLQNGMNSDHDSWSVDMGLSDEESLIYTHIGTQFDIYNAGNVPIHPFDQDLKITISQVVGSTEYLELKNSTNGTLFRVNEGVNGTKVIVLDGPEITSNGLQYTRMTNKEFIELNKGWNSFEIKGATSAKVEFDFRFYYL
jgi:phage-related protein